MGENPINCKCGKPRTVTNIIFDLDGTILNSEIHYNKAFEEVCALYGKKYTEKEEMKILGCPSDVCVRILIDTLDIPVSQQEYLDKYHEVAHRLVGESELMPGAEELIKHFHKHQIPMAIATSSYPEGFEIKTKHHKELLKMFHHIVLNVDPEVKKGKPFPDIFLVAAKRFDNKPKPNDCLVIEDSPNGLKAAKAAKMQCCIIPEERVPKSLLQGANLVLSSLSEFKPELFGLPPMD